MTGEDRYEGETNEDGAPHGQGTLFFSNGDRFEGHFEFGGRHGWGVNYYANGDLLYEEWCNGEQGSWKSQGIRDSEWSGWWYGGGPWYFIALGCLMSLGIYDLTNEEFYISGPLLIPLICTMGTLCFLLPLGVLLASWEAEARADELKEERLLLT